MTFRSIIAALTATALIGACSADIHELNRCYALGKAVCTSMRITPKVDCIDELNRICIDSGVDVSAVDDCTSAIQSKSGDDYGGCLDAVPDGCSAVWSEVLATSGDGSGAPGALLAGYESGCEGISFSGGDENSCNYAFDGACDEPSLCAPGTDTADCDASSGGGTTSPNSCSYAFDGACDEPDLCAPGTDTADCDASSGGGTTSPNGCTYAFDGACDEPSLCAPGTDTADCDASSGGGTTSPNPCTYAFDGACDEPDLCAPGTDTADCQGSSSSACGVAPAQPSGASCPGSAPMYCGGGSCCSSSTPYHCAATGQCYERAEDASADCQFSAGGCLQCVPGNSGGGTVTPGSCPCSLDTAPCSPDPLAPACYCAMAAASYCLADNAGACQADAAAARAQGDEYVQAAFAIDPSVQAAGCR